MNPPPVSPHIWWKTFWSDILCRLIVAMSSYSFFFDLPLSCLIVAKDEANHGLWTNRLEMIFTRQVVLAAFSLHQDGAALFAKNVGRFVIVA